jgi:hypothetical protein
MWSLVFPGRVGCFVPKHFAVPARADAGNGRSTAESRGNDSTSTTAYTGETDPEYALSSETAGTHTR